MNVRNEYFSASLNSKLEATDIYLPISEGAAADLKALLKEPDDYIYLTLKDDVNLETVRVRNEQGTLMLERGLEGTEAVTHPFGTCIMSVSPTVVALIKDLICSYECCEGPCPVEPVVCAGTALPEYGNVGAAFNGCVIFTGSSPMNIVMNGAPAWLSALQMGNTLILSGTPDKAGTTTFSVAATNGNGTNVVSHSLSVTIKD